MNPALLAKLIGIKLSPQVIKWAVIIILSLIIIWWAGKKLKAWQLKRANNRELRDLEKEGNKPSFRDSQYLAWADTIENELGGRGTSWGDKPLTKEILMGLRNTADVIKLNEAFGTRTSEGEKWWGLGDAEVTLPALISTEFDKDEKQELNEAYRRKGIDFRWS